MNFMAKIKNFVTDESGAVTVDWVVLTAAIVGLGIAVVASVRTGVTTLGTNISTSLTTTGAVTALPTDLNDLTP